MQADMVRAWNRTEGFADGGWTVFVRSKVRVTHGFNPPPDARVVVAQLPRTRENDRLISVHTERGILAHEVSHALNLPDRYPYAPKDPVAVLRRGRRVRWPVPEGRTRNVKKGEDPSQVLDPVRFVPSGIDLSVSLMRDSSAAPTRRDLKYLHALVMGHATGEGAHHQAPPGAELDTEEHTVTVEELQGAFQRLGYGELLREQDTVPPGPSPGPPIPELRPHRRLPDRV